MPFEPFYEKFGQLAEDETRSITLFPDNDFGLPSDKYVLVEAFCNDENCDCRRTFFNVLSWTKMKMLAVVYFGWESESFYYNWFSPDNPFAREGAGRMVGVGLNESSEQSELAPALMDMVVWVLSSDRAYVDRIQRHYWMFKEAIDPKHFGKGRKPQKNNSGSKRKRHRSRNTDN